VARVKVGAGRRWERWDRKAARHGAAVMSCGEVDGSGIVLRRALMDGKLWWVKLWLAVRLSRGKSVSAPCKS